MTARADSSIAIGGGVGADSVGARRARRDHRPGTCARNLYSKLPEREREPRRAASRRWRTPSDGSRSAKAARSARGRPTPAITPSARRSRSLSAPGHSAVRRALRRLECPTAHSSLPTSHDRSTARAVTPRRCGGTTGAVRFRSSSSGHSAPNAWPLWSAGASTVDDLPDTRAQISSPRSAPATSARTGSGGRIPWPVRSCPSWSWSTAWRPDRPQLAHGSDSAGSPAAASR